MKKILSFLVVILVATALMAADDDAARITVSDVYVSVTNTASTDSLMGLVHSVQVMSPTSFTNTITLSTVNGENVLNSVTTAGGTNTYYPRVQVDNNAGTALGSSNRFERILIVAETLTATVTSNVSNSTNDVIIVIKLDR